MQRIFDYSLLFVLGYLCRPVAPFTATSFLVKRPNSQCERSKLNLLPPDAASSAADSLLVPTPSSLGWMSHVVIAADTNAAENDTGLLSNQAIIVTFIIGLIPFVVATVEFWRRIAVGDSFGTGNDSVVIIGEDDAPLSSRGRRVLGKGALLTAYILFAIATAVLGIVLYAVITSPENPLPVNLPLSTE